MDMSPANCVPRSLQEPQQMLREPVTVDTHQVTKGVETVGNCHLPLLLCEDPQPQGHLDVTHCSLGAASSRLPRP